MVIEQNLERVDALHDDCICQLFLKVFMCFGHIQFSHVYTDNFLLYYLCSGQFLTLKRDCDMWQARGYNERKTVSRPLTEYLRHPTLDQEPKSLGSTPTRRPRLHLRSSAQGPGFNPDSSAPTSPLELPTSPIPSRHWKFLEDSSNTAQWRDSRNYQIKCLPHRLNIPYLRPTDLIYDQ